MPCAPNCPSRQAVRWTTRLTLPYSEPQNVTAPLRPQSQKSKASRLKRGHHTGKSAAMEPNLLNVLEMCRRIASYLPIEAAVPCRLICQMVARMLVPYINLNLAMTCNTTWVFARQLSVIEAVGVLAALDRGYSFLLRVFQLSRVMICSRSWINWSVPRNFVVWPLI